MDGFTCAMANHKHRRKVEMLTTENNRKTTKGTDVNTKLEVERMGDKREENVRKNWRKKWHQETNIREKEMM